MINIALVFDNENYYYQLVGLEKLLMSNQLVALIIYSTNHSLKFNHN